MSYPSFLETVQWSWKPEPFDRVYRYAEVHTTNRYWSTYHKMLEYCFGEDGPPSAVPDYSVGPFLLPSSVLKTIHRRDNRSLEFLAVCGEKGIVMFAQVVDKDKQSELEPHGVDTYCLADEQMRAAFTYLTSDGTLPQRFLYGLSFVDKNLRVYRGDQLTGEVIPSAKRRLGSSDWGTEILSQDGFDTMKNIVEYAKGRNIEAEA